MRLTVIISLFCFSNFAICSPWNLFKANFKDRYFLKNKSISCSLKDHFLNDFVKSNKAELFTSGKVKISSNERVKFIKPKIINQDETIKKMIDLHLRDTDSILKMVFDELSMPKKSEYKKLRRLKENDSFYYLKNGLETTINFSSTSNKIMAKKNGQDFDIKQIIKRLTRIKKLVVGEISVKTKIPMGNILFKIKTDFFNYKQVIIPMKITTDIRYEFKKRVNKSFILELKKCEVQTTK